VLGRPVMVLRNDALLGLFNGDLGLLLPGPDGSLGAAFPATGGGETRWLPALHLPEHETAFAMTVHKAQGSEFDEVLLLLPATPHRVLSRELLYTALSRGRRGIGIAAPASVILAAADSPTRRLSGLQARLREI
jgi:exodeoxyribonuclease V alpha subunit